MSKLNSITNLPKEDKMCIRDSNHTDRNEHDDRNYHVWRDHKMDVAILKKRNCFSINN